MDGFNLGAAFCGAPDPFDDPPPKTSDDNSFLDNIDGMAWDEQVAKDRAPIDGEEAIRYVQTQGTEPISARCKNIKGNLQFICYAGFY